MLGPMGTCRRRRRSHRCRIASHCTWGCRGTGRSLSRCLSPRRLHSCHRSRLTHRPCQRSSAGRRRFGCSNTPASWRRCRSCRCTHRHRRPRRRNQGYTSLECIARLECTSTPASTNRSCRRIRRLRTFGPSTRADTRSARAGSENRRASSGCNRRVGLRVASSAEQSLDHVSWPLVDAHHRRYRS